MKQVDLNSDYVIQSLQLQLSEYSMKVAERDAMITQQQEHIRKNEKELEELRKEQIKEMDENAE